MAKFILLIAALSFVSCAGIIRGPHLDPVDPDNPQWVPKVPITGIPNIGPAMKEGSK